VRAVILPFLSALLVAAAPSPFPGAVVTPLCGAKAIPYQQQAVASTADGVWIACRSAGTVVRVSPATGRIVVSRRLAGFRPWAIAAGNGGLWTIDRDRAETWRLDPRTGARIARVPLPATPASLWVGAGSAWIGFDGTGFARVPAKTRRVSTNYAGDGVSAFASDGKRVYAVSHRDNSISAVTLATGRVSTLARGLADTRTSATEQAVFAGGSLWLTGRGLDLLRVDPRSGKVRATVEVGPAGLALAAVGGKVLVASYTDDGARRGDPVVGAFAVVDPATGAVGPAAAATSSSYLSGLAVRNGKIFAADTVLGRLVRLSLP
jgi:DNA-binding beta-propeller fold protein YncE